MPHRILALMADVIFNIADIECRARGFGNAPHNRPGHFDRRALFVLHFEFLDAQRLRAQADGFFSHKRIGPMKPSIANRAVILPPADQHAAPIV